MTDPAPDELQLQPIELGHQDRAFLAYQGELARQLDEDAGRVARFVQQGRNAQASLAQALEQECEGGQLRCRSCGARMDLQPGQAGLYVGTGWPTCCGGTTMELLTARQLAGEGSNP